MGSGEMTEKEKYEKIVLSADIGGTNSNFSIVGFKRGIPEILLFKRESTASADELSDLVNKFFVYAKEKKFEPEVACFAVAGPVESKKEYQTVKMTNADLVVDSRNVLRKTPLINVLIINDFEAISYAINVLRREDIMTLNEGEAVEKGVRAVVGAGTGLGKNILHFHENVNAYIPISSEGGHSDLPLLNEEELRMAEFIKKIRNIKNQVSYEDVLSGRGLENIYKYLSTTMHPSSPRDLSAEEISKTKETNPCSKDTFEWFVRFYARCARNFVLESLARGGLYIAGGIAAKNIDSFSNFMEEFVKNERFYNLLKNIPVHIITNYDISLFGAAYALTVRKYI